jgi:hypothetical protein
MPRPTDEQAQRDREICAQINDALERGAVDEIEDIIGDRDIAEFL